MTELVKLLIKKVNKFEKVAMGIKGPRVRTTVSRRHLYLSLKDSAVTDRQASMSREPWTLGPRKQRLKKKL